jgi:hypothetical protein
VNSTRPPMVARRGSQPPLGRAVDIVLPLAAIAVLIAFVGLAAWSASQAGTLGFDFLSYDSAVRRFLAGGVLYDQNFDTTGPFGLFYYPPPFVLLAIPLTIVEPAVAAWLVTGLLLVTFVAAIAILPVSARVRWLTLLLGGLSWPLVYAIKLGQVGPILLLTFAIGWRWMDRPARIGIATAIGTAIKLQPAIVFGWALLTGRRRAVVIGLAVFALLALAATVIAGPGSWSDQIGLLIKLSRPVTTAHNMTPGRIAFEAGLSEQVAFAIQVANWAAVAVVVLVAIRWATHVASYLAVVVASQLISPILWDHYALMLLLPVAWLVTRGRPWLAAVAIAVPLATSVLLVNLIPPVAYPIAYWVTLLALVWQGWTERRRERAALDATWPVPRPVSPREVA